MVLSQLGQALLPPHLGQDSGSWRWAGINAGPLPWTGAEISS